MNSGEHSTTTGIYLKNYSAVLPIIAVYVIAMPKKDNIKNEIFRLVSPAINPTTGGPIKRPIIPIDETAAIATGVGICLNLPAALKTSGTAGDTPMPTRKKPVVAPAREGNSMAINKPAVIKIPHSAMIFLNPMRLCSQSVINLAPVIEIINAV